MPSPITYERWITHLQNLPVVALVTTGRTGSDFLQSLLDFHPQIASFNGHFAVYSEFFTNALTFSILGARPADAADEFIGRYLYKLVSFYDIQEAKDTLGDDYCGWFRIDTALFKAHIVGLMGDLPLTSRNFLLAIYGAYNLCLGQNIDLFRLFFHHPHLDYELKYFLSDFPNSRLIFSVRDPRANFCSHVENFRQYYKSHDNQQHIFKCLQMALEDSILADIYGLEYTAVRLEDLPREEIIKKLANWLNIEFNETMLRSTWAGLDWHGDRISIKKFASTGWSPDRTENGWEKKLGMIEKYIINYITYYRLIWYNYKVNKITFLDTLFVPFLILLPFKCEKRLWSLDNLIYVWKKKDIYIFYQLLLFFPFYIKRIKLCYRFYLQTFQKRKFERNWLNEK